jgi:hypothetical protein
MQTKIAPNLMIALLLMMWMLGDKMAVCQEVPHHSPLFLPLLDSINRGDVSKVHGLLLHHADANEVGTFYNDGLTPVSPLVYAVGVLTACDGDSNRQAHVTAICKDLVHFGARIDQRGNLDETPLMVSAELTDTGLLTYLLTRGAKINACDNYKETPLMYAVRENSPNLNVPNSQAVIVLLNHGALVNLKDAAGDTALMLLAHYFPSEHNHAAADKIASEVARRLFIHGANPWLHNTVQQTAFSIAQANKMPKLAFLLEQVMHRHEKAASRLGKE